MARIAGVDLPREKRIEVGLTYVYGIGQSTADEILAGTGINPDTRGVPGDCDMLNVARAMGISLG